MRVDEFDFDLPDDRIALRPQSPRDAARLLVVEPPDRFHDRRVGDLPDVLRPGDLLVFNDTKVIGAALAGRRLGRGTEPLISVLLLERVNGSQWRALAKPGRRLTIGDRIRFGGEGRVCLLGTLEATVAAKGEGGEVTLAFDVSGPILDEFIDAIGDMPLPPYIAARRPADERDRTDYQTLFARAEGAVAAPTAGLHFTPDLMQRLERRGIGHAVVTLHVGAGTFLPVRTPDIESHVMHPERACLSTEAADRVNGAKKAGHRIVAVGTTSLRLLESSADVTGRSEAYEGETRLFITPGYRFRIVDALITNFHLPRSTLFMLVAAFSGLDTMKQAYAHAIARGYRFYSYGDASLLFPATS